MQEPAAVEEEGSRTKAPDDIRRPGDGQEVTARPEVPRLLRQGRTPHERDREYRRGSPASARTRRRTSSRLRGKRAVAAPKAGKKERPRLSADRGNARGRGRGRDAGVSQETFRFQEISEGLPKSGCGARTSRSATARARTSADRRAAPALHGANVRVFRLGRDEDGTWRWRSVKLEVREPRGASRGLRGVALGDVDGDGRLDIVFGGPRLRPGRRDQPGRWRVPVESRGLPRAVFDALDRRRGRERRRQAGPPRISDDAEWIESPASPRAWSDYLGIRRAALPERGRALPRGAPRPRRRLLRVRRARVPKDARRAPFFSSDCRYLGSPTRSTSTTRRRRSSLRRRGTGRELQPDDGAAAGTYRGRPAVYTSWFKRSPDGRVAEDRRPGDHGLLP